MHRRRMANQGKGVPYSDAQCDGEESLFGLVETASVLFAGQLVKCRNGSEPDDVQNLKRWNEPDGSTMQWPL